MPYIPLDYAVKFTHEWNRTVWKLVSSGVDLNKIVLKPADSPEKIVSAEKEQK